MSFLMLESCPICHSKNRDLFYKGSVGDYTQMKLDQMNFACTSSAYARYFDLMKCRECDLIYSKIQPSNESVERLYGQVQDDVYLEEEDGRVKTFRRMFNDLATFCPKKGKMFEIGSYTGVYLDLARQEGWDVSGAEFSQWARKVASDKRGLHLLRSMDDLGPETAASFDSVVLWDVIEHVTDPKKIIQKAAALLKPGGILGLSTIFLDSISARTLKAKYPFLMDMHLIYFTKKTLVRLLEDCGFEIVAYKRHRRYVSYMYILNKIPGLSLLNRIPGVTAIFKKIFFQCSFGLRDVYAQKVA